MTSTQKLNLPTAGAVLDLADQFYPGAPALRPDPAPPAIDELEAGLGCLLLDDQHNVVGALAADLRATLAFGGRLMMLAEGPLAEQAKAGAADPQIAEAMGEVFNHLTIALNNVPDNLHVRTTFGSLPINDLLARPEAGWIAQEPHGSLKLSADAFGGKGHLWIMIKDGHQ